MKTVDMVAQAATDFYNELKIDKNGRYRSWEYCYYDFYKARKMQTLDVEHLSLQLAFYLASWGMYRGSSFLLQKDYRIHIPVIEELLKKKYDALCRIECKAMLETDNQDLLKELSGFIREYYSGVRRSVKGEDLKSAVSSTLITKVLMGTLGCVPAYDRYFVDGLKSKKVAAGSYNIKSIVQLAKFYEENFDALEAVRRKLMVKDILYPQMKLLDMGFWQIGASKQRKIM